MRQQSPRLHNPSTHRHLRNGNPARPLSKRSPTQHLSQKRHKDGNEGEFDTLGKSGAYQRRRRRRQKATIGRNFPAPARFRNGDTKPQGRSSSGISSQDNHCHAQPIHFLLLDYFAGPAGIILEAIPCAKQGRRKVASLAKEFNKRTEREKGL